MLLKKFTAKGKIFRQFSILILTTLLFSFFTSASFATTSVSISPSSGSYAGSFSFNVVLDISGGEQVSAIDLNINYTGPVEFVTAANGVQNCSPSVNATAGRVNVLCAGLDYFQSGNLVRLTFVATGTGTASFAIEVVDTDASISGTTGATYSVTSSGGTGGGGELPTTAVLDVRSASVGTLLLALGLGSFLLGHTISRAPDEDLTYVDRTLSDKVK